MVNSQGPVRTQLGDLAGTLHKYVPAALHSLVPPLHLEAAACAAAATLCCCYPCSCCCCCCYHCCCRLSHVNSYLPRTFWRWWRGCSFGCRQRRLLMCFDALQPMAHDARAMPLFRNLLCAQDTAGCFRYTGESRGVLLKRNQHEQAPRDHRRLADCFGLHNHHK